MRRAYVSLMAFLTVLALGPVAGAHGVGQVDYNLDEGGQVSASLVIDEFDLDDDEFEDVSFAVEGDVTVTMTCEKELKFKTLEKYRTFDYEVDEVVDYELIYAGQSDNPLRYELDDVTLDEDIRTMCPGGPGGWRTSDVNVDTDIDLIVYFDDEDYTLMNGTVELEA